MSLSFPHLIHPAADSYYLFLYMADICRVWPNHFSIPQGERSSNNFPLHPGSPALTMKLVCQVIRFHSFYQTCQILWIIAILECGSFFYCSEWEPVIARLGGCCSVYNVVHRRYAAQVKHIRHLKQKHDHYKYGNGRSCSSFNNRLLLTVQ